MKKLTSWLLILTMLVTLLPLPAAVAESGTLLIPEKTVTIEEEAFAGLTGITTVVVPNTVEAIGSKAFADCPNLSEIYFGNNTSIEIEPDAFLGCSQELHFYVYPDTPAELFAFSRGYLCDSDTKSYTERVKSLVAEHGGMSTLQGDFDSMRLLVHRSSSRLPDISAFEPVSIIRDSELFVIQLSTEQQTRDCYAALLNDQREHGSPDDFVEPDKCVAAIISDADEVVAAGVVDAYDWVIDGEHTDDPIGFDAYAPFIAEHGAGAKKIAIIDSGTANHASYSARLDWDNAINFVPDGEDWTADSKTHGSFVAAVINECVGNANVTLLPIRVIGSAGGATSGILDNLLLGQAINYAVAAGADIINLSLNCQRSAYVEHCIKAAAKAGRTIVVSAGNAGGDVSEVFPANMDEVVTVGGLDFNFKIRGNYGAAIDYVAPYRVIKTSAYGSNMGTSFSAPMIAAALALVDMDPWHDLAAMDASCLLPNETGSSANSYGHGMPRLDKLVDIPVIRIVFDPVPPSVMAVGETFELGFSFEPEIATNKQVAVSSDSESILVENHEDGSRSLKANTKGSAKITAVSDSTGVTVSQDITVVQPVKTITIHGGQSTLPLTRTMQLSAGVSPADASTPDVEWHTSDPSVAVVSQTGLVTPKKLGEVNIWAEATDGYGARSDNLQVTIIPQPDPEEIQLFVNGEKITDGQISMIPGSTYQLEANVLPEDANQRVRFRAVGGYATVNQTGDCTADVTAVSSGVSYITVTTYDGSISADLKVTVLVMPESVLISGESEVNINESITLTATVLPTNAYDRTVTWQSNNDTIASVDANGVVTGHNEGTAIITATAKGDVHAQCMVTVRHPYTLSFNANSPESGLTPSVSFSSKSAISGIQIGALPSASCDYYDFVGWYTAPSGGEKKNDSSVINTSETSVTLYAHWQIHPESGWVLESEVPEGARITQTGYSYRESTESTYSSMNGWIPNGSYWNQTGSGSKQYASFPSTYDTSHWTYRELNGSAYDAFENESAKRIVSNTHTGYVYWHWAYNAAYANNTNRWISDRIQNAGPKQGLKEYYYCYFYAFKSATNAPVLGIDQVSFVFGANAKHDKSIRSYNCANCLPSGADTSPTSGLNNPRFLRLDYYTSTYTDYQKIYKYYRDQSNMPTDPGSGGNGISISNKVTYVKYLER